MKSLLTVLALLLTYLSSAQTCCSAGAPTSSSLDITLDQAKQWSVQLGYEYKSINLLISDNKRLENDPRSRFGQNLSLKVDYALTEKWAFSAFLPLVHQARKTISEEQSSFGAGDLMIFGQYTNAIGGSTKISFAGGVKIPTGITDQLGSSGILLSPDMQSGSGSLDYLLRVAISKKDFAIPFLSSYFSGTYRKNGINNNFGQTDNFSGRRFGFGDELITAIGLSYNWTTRHAFIIPDLSIRWRRGNANTEQNTSAPNSGGNWLSIPFGISAVPNEKHQLRIYAELPVYQSLDGLQITTDLTVGLQYKHIVNQKSKL